MSEAETRPSQNVFNSEMRPLKCGYETKINLSYNSARIKDIKPGSTGGSPSRAHTI